MSFLKNNKIQLLVIVGVAIILLLLIKTYWYDNKSTPTEAFYDYDSESPITQEPESEQVERFAKEEEEEEADMQEGFENPPQASDPLGMNETGRAVNESGDVSNLGQFLPSECYPKDVLSSADLLPGGASSTWAQVVPAGQGALTDQNFLTSGHHLGMNTVGNSLRNASYDLRSELPNPQAQVSPWNQTTIGPDLMRRPLDGN